MTSRRGFLGAVGAAIAGLVALPRILEAKPERYEDWNLGLIDVINSPQASELLQLRALKLDLNATLYPRGMRLELKKEEDRNALIGAVHDFRHNHGRVCWLRVGLSPRALDRAEATKLALRHLRYQVHKAAEQIDALRSHGYLMEVVDRADHPLSGRIFYRHYLTGQVRWSVPA